MTRSGSREALIDSQVRNVVDGYGSSWVEFLTGVGPDLQTATRADGDRDGGMARWRDGRNFRRVSSR
jgi:hypothetical protein